MTTKYESKKHLKSAWVSRSKDNYEEKPWGKEKTWTGFSGVHGKLLYIDSGKKTSLKFHSQKSEVLFLKTGKIKVIFGNECAFSDPVANPLQTEVLEPGDALLVQSGCPYRIIALENSEMIEIGNHSAEKPVRVIDDYGRESENVENLARAISEHT
tara:strand:+ start:8961 stop:9428 length:468 start_codon:yes stop_codon:yes gene_type:complete